jgi:hypothetical protein
MEDRLEQPTTITGKTIRPSAQTVQASGEKRGIGSLIVPWDGPDIACRCGGISVVVGR